MPQTPEGYTRTQFGGRYNLCEMIVNRPALERGQAWADEFVNARQRIQVLKEGWMNSNRSCRLPFGARK